MSDQPVFSDADEAFHKAYLEAMKWGTVDALFPVCHPSFPEDLMRSLAETTDAMMMKPATKETL